MISKTPRTLIFRDLALYSISRYLCGHFVLSKTEHGVISTLESSRAQDSRRDEARLFAPSRPRPRAAQGTSCQGCKTRHARHVPGNVVCNNARHSINTRTNAERDQREVRFFCILGGIRPSYSWILAYVELERINEGQHFQIGIISKFESNFFSRRRFFMAASKSCWCSPEYY